MSACGSLYPGGHGEDRECVLPKGHSGQHEYARVTGPSPLDRIEAAARTTLESSQTPAEHVLWKPWAMDRADDVLALVEIAKAMQEIAQDYHCVIAEPDPDAGQHLEGCVGCFARAALDRLPNT